MDDALHRFGFFNAPRFFSFRDWLNPPKEQH